jgi:hypothetical protein
MASLGCQTHKERRCHPIGYILRQIQANAKITDQNLLEALHRVMPPDVIHRVVAQHGIARQRQRKLSAEFALYLIVAMHLFSSVSLAQVLIKLLKGFRYIWSDPGFIPASKGAISQVRYAIGTPPMVDLFHAVCQPMATEETPGAFLFGLRLMALDGSEEMIADTPENERVFGRHANAGEAAYPQVQSVYLEEIGTHAIVDAGFWPIHTSERTGGFRLLRSVQAGMLLLWDAGFHSFEMVQHTLQRNAHFLGRVPAGVKLIPICPLPDGSVWVDLVTRDHHGRVRQRLRVRLIEYTVGDPALPGYGERRRLITSLLDWQRYPALELACAYHERWEIEITIDELATHQRLAFHPLRSLKPVGVLQELYGLLVAHYAIRKIMLEAAHTAGLDPDRMSFINALCLIAEAIPEFQQTAPQEHARLYGHLLQDIARFRLPPRQARVNPRVVKRQRSPFDKKRAEHAHWPQPKTSFGEAIQLLI